MSFFTISAWIREIRETRRKGKRFTGLNDVLSVRERERAEERAFYSDGKAETKKVWFLVGEEGFLMGLGLCSDLAGVMKCVPQDFYAAPARSDWSSIYHYSLAFGPSVYKVYIHIKEP